jgi:hypothetical protein
VKVNKKIGYSVFESSFFQLKFLPSNHIPTYVRYPIPAIVKTITIITIAMIMVTIHITRALPQDVSYTDLMINKFAAIANIKPIKPNQDNNIKARIRSTVVPKAFRSPSSSSSNLAVRYNGSATNMIRRRTTSTKIAIPIPQMV